jgi:beta-galactosidase
VAGWTMYFGVFYGEDITAETRAFLLEQHARMPDKPILVCEYGYWSGSDGGQEAEQVRVAEETLDAMLPLAAVDETGAVTDGFLAGVTWWCQFNWYRVQTPRIQSMGITRMDRETHKPVRATLVDRYAPYFSMGGLAAE